jgi:hypothetical protein
MFLSSRTEYEFYFIFQELSIDLDHFFDLLIDSRKMEEYFLQFGSLTFFHFITSSRCSADFERNIILIFNIPLYPFPTAEQSISDSLLSYDPSSKTFDVTFHHIFLKNLMNHIQTLSNS